MSCESQGWRYCWFIISSTFFFGICYTLRVQSKELLEVCICADCAVRSPCRVFNLLSICCPLRISFAQLLGEEEKEVGTLYKNLLYLFLICWLVYPILFIVGHNGGVLEPSTYLEIITVPLEIVAKGIAGIVVCPVFSQRRPLFILALAQRIILYCIDRPADCNDLRQD